MNLRPLDQIPEHVLMPLVVIGLRPEQVADLLEKDNRDEPLARMVCELFWTLRGCREKARLVESLIDEVFQGFGTNGDSISALSPQPSLVYKSQNPRLVAAVLWYVARRQGLAWRRLETRLQMTLFALVASSRRNVESNPNRPWSDRLADPCLSHGKEVALQQ